MESTFWWIIGLTILGAGSQLILGPILVYLKNTTPACLQMEVTDLEGVLVFLPSNYRNTLEALTALGFSRVFTAKNWTVESGQFVVFTLLINRSTMEMANVTNMTVYREGIASLSIGYVEFTTDFRDGREVNTNNNPEPSIFVQGPKKSIYGFPGELDLRVLYSLHSKLSKGGGSGTKILPQPGEELEYLLKGMREDVKRQFSVGYFRTAVDAVTHRPSIKGALLMTWKLAWPVGSILRWRKRVGAARLRRELLPS